MGHRKKDIDLWDKLDIHANKLPLPCRIIYDSFRIFMLEHCIVRATALAYTSLLAVVPLMILLSSISLYLGVGELFITHLPVLLPEILEKVLPYINNVLNLLSLDNTIDLSAMTDLILKNVMPFLVKAQEISLGSLGVIGGLGLLVTFILAIDTIESNMNIVWGVNETRGYGQKVAIFIPFLLLFAGGIGICGVLLHYMHEMLKKILTQSLSFGKFGDFLLDLSIPTVLLSFALAGLWALYCYMPYVPSEYNFWRAFIEKTKKRWFSAVISTAFTYGAIFLFFTAMIFVMASMFAKWSLFYGSLAVFPMIMFLLFGSWCIILFGNALCWRITMRNSPKTYFLKRIKKLSTH